MNLELEKKKRSEMASKIHSFIKSIENNNYVIDDFTKVTKLTERIGSGDDTPITNFTTLMNLKHQLDSFDIENLSKDFRDEIRLALEEVSKYMKENTKAPEVVDERNNLTEIDKFNKLLNEVKVKAGIVLSVDRVKEAEENREKTYQKIINLSNNTEISSEEKMTEYKRLLNIYNGPNLEAVTAAKNITARGNVNLTDEKINELVIEFNDLYQEIMRMNLDDQVKKNMIDAFSKIAKICTNYKADLSKRKTYQNRYEKLSLDLGISYKDIKRKDKKQEEIKEEKKSTEETNVKDKSDEVEPIKEKEIEEVKLDAIEEKPLETSDLNKIFDNEEKFNVVYNGNVKNPLGETVPDTDILEVGKNYTVEDVKIINGIQHYKLEGFDAMYDSSVFNIFDIVKEEELSKEATKENAQIIDNTEEDLNVEITEEPEIIDAKYTKNEDIGKKVKVVKKFKPGLGSKVLKGIALVSLIGAYYFTPVAFVSAAIWIYASLRDRFDIKDSKGLFDAIFKKLKENIRNSKEITDEDKAKTKEELEEVLSDLNEKELTTEKGMSR